jgi:hypothetical protein
MLAILEDIQKQINNVLLLSHVVHVAYSVCACSGCVRVEVWMMATILIGSAMMLHDLYFNCTMIWTENAARG